MIQTVSDVNASEIALEIKGVAGLYFVEITDALGTIHNLKLMKR